MISWWQIGYGAVLSGLVAALVLFFAGRPRRLPVVVAGGVATVAGAVAWNAILRAAHGDQFFTDAPLVLLPASWQDTGSGVFALATSGLLLGLAVAPTAPARRVAGYGRCAGWRRSSSMSTCTDRRAGLTAPVVSGGRGVLRTAGVLLGGWAPAGPCQSC